MFEAKSLTTKGDSCDAAQMAMGPLAERVAPHESRTVLAASLLMADTACFAPDIHARSAGQTCIAGRLPDI